MMNITTGLCFIHHFAFIIFFLSRPSVLICLRARLV